MIFILIAFLPILIGYLRKYPPYLLLCDTERYTVERHLKACHYYAHINIMLLYTVPHKNQHFMQKYGPK